MPLARDAGRDDMGRFARIILRSARGWRCHLFRKSLLHNGTEMGQERPAAAFCQRGRRAGSVSV